MILTFEAYDPKAYIIILKVVIQVGGAESYNITDIA